MFKKTQSVSKDVWLASQKKVFGRWVEAQLKKRGIKVKDVIIDMKSGYLLYNLVEVLFQTKLSFRYDENMEQRAQFNRIYTLGTLDQILNYLKNMDVKVTCGPEDIFNCNVTLIMGLLWVLILKFQNIQREPLLRWVNYRLSSMGIDLKVKNFSESFSDGLALAYLLYYFDKDAIDIDVFKKGEPLTSIKEVFVQAKRRLKIPQILEPSDIFPTKPSEKVVMTYVSYFRNLDEQYDPDQVTPEPTPKGKIKVLSEKVEKVNKTIANALHRPKPIYVTIDSNELQSLKDEIDSLHALLAKRDGQILEKDMEVKEKDEQITQLKNKLNAQEKIIYKKNIIAQKAERRFKKAYEQLRQSKINEARIQEKFDEEIQFLLQQQRESQEEIEMVKRRASLYAKAVVELQGKVKEYNIHSDTLSREINQVIKYNEDLRARVKSLESEIAQATQKTEELYAWLKDMTETRMSDTNLADKLSQAVNRVARMVEQYNELKLELHYLSMKHEETVVYVEWLDKEFIKEKNKRSTLLKKYKVLVARRQQVIRLGGEVNEHISQLITYNNKKLDVMQSLMIQFNSDSTDEDFPRPRRYSPTLSPFSSSKKIKTSNPSSKTPRSRNRSPNVSPKSSNSPKIPTSVKNTYKTPKVETPVITKLKTSNKVTKSAHRSLEERHLRKYRYYENIKKPYHTWDRIKFINTNQWERNESPKQKSPYNNNPTNATPRKNSGENSKLSPHLIGIKGVKSRTPLFSTIRSRSEEKRQTMEKANNDDAGYTEILVTEDKSVNTTIRTFIGPQEDRNSLNLSGKQAKISRDKWGISKRKPHTPGNENGTQRIIQESDWYI